VVVYVGWRAARSRLSPHKTHYFGSPRSVPERMSSGKVLGSSTGAGRNRGFGIPLGAVATRQRFWHKRPETWMFSLPGAFDGSRSLASSSAPP
jgi:hypothetical protein